MFGYCAFLGALMEIVTHATDLARHPMGEIMEVKRTLSGNAWKVTGIENNAVAVLKSPSGVHVSSHATSTEWRGYPTSKGVDHMEGSAAPTLRCEHAGDFGHGWRSDEDATHPTSGNSDPREAEEVAFEGVAVVRGGAERLSRDDAGEVLIGDDRGPFALE